MTETKKNMTMERFEAMLAAYGGDRSRWPAEERVSAIAFLASHPECHKLLADEAWLDRALATDGAVDPSPALAGRIMATFPRAGAKSASSRAGRFRGLLGEWWPSSDSAWPAGMLAGAAALGLVIGIVGFPLSAGFAGGSPSAEDVVGYVFAADVSLDDWE